MSMQSRARRNSLAVLALLLTYSALLSWQQQGRAYTTLQRWPQGTDVVYYSWDPNSTFANLPGMLNQGATIKQAIMNAAGQWHIVSWLTFPPPTTGRSSLWGVRNEVDGLWGVTYSSVPPALLDSVSSYLNTDYTWTLDGADPAVTEVSLHEWGHWIDLADNPSGTYEGAGQTVMAYPTNKKALFIDDKEAATMIYGIWTQFEQSQFLGLYQIAPTYETGVFSFGNCGSGDPDYWTYTTSSQSIPTPPSGGLRVMMFRGCAVANGTSPNYAYMSLARSFDDVNAAGPVVKCGEPCYIKVRSNTHLKWEQYNVTACTISIDLEFTDGTTLRDSGLTDQYGVGVHPDDRTCFSGWRSIDINLGSLQGKTIKRWMIAYDNPNGSGTWRTYIDNLRLDY